MPSMRPGEAAVEHDGDHVAVVPQVDELVVEVPIVRVDGSETRLEAGVHGLEVLRAVVEVLGDLVLLLHPGVEVRLGDAVRPPVVVAPGDAVVSVHLGGGVGHLLGHDLPHVGEAPTRHRSPSVVVQDGW